MTTVTMTTPARASGTVAALVGNLRPGMVLPCRSSGRRMQLVCVEGPHLRLTVAKGDPEFRQWRSWGTEVLWPPDWCWLPGQQIEFTFANTKEQAHGTR
jgi:hypothetical protein